MFVQRILVAATCCFALFGCRKTPARMHFIIPDGFRGTFKVVEDPASPSIVVDKRDGGDVAVIPVGVDGVVKVKNIAVFQRWHEVSAAFASGTAVPFGAAVQVPSGTIALYGMYSDRSGASWYFVGTPDEYKAAMSAPVK